MSRVRGMLVAPALLAGGATGALASEGGGGEALIQPHLGTIFWTILTFLIFAFLLRKYAWGPLIGALDARASSVRDEIERARNDRELAEKTLAEHRQLVAEAHRERAAAMAEGQQEAVYDQVGELIENLLD